MAQSNLSAAKEAKNDEFYTQLSDIQTELKHYSDKFKGKVVFCNCDDPFESNFVKYFLMNFNRLGLKELISTGYKTSKVGGVEIETTNTPYVLRVTDTSKYLIGTQKDLDIKGAKYFLETESSHILSPLIGNKALDKNGNQIQISVKVEATDKDGNIIMIKNKKGESKPKMKIVKQDLYYEAGDFRSNMSLALLDESDIVVTNPPFSLFREYIATLVEHNKKFLIIGNLNALSNKEIFPLLGKDELWMGCTYFNGGAAYFMGDAALYDPKKMSNPKNAYIKNNILYWRVNGVRWYTNIDHEKRHQMLPLDLGFTYAGHEDMYPKYDNYDAIEVAKVNHIPCDYTGIMGVPVSFMDKYCPEQFEIIGCSQRGCHDNFPDIKKYDDWWEVEQDGTLTGSKGGKTNENPNLARNDGKNNYFTNINGDIIQSCYTRIFIKFTNNYIKTHPEQFKKEDNNGNENCSTD